MRVKSNKFVIIIKIKISTKIIKMLPLHIHKNAMHLLKTVKGAEIYLKTMENFVINIMQN